MFKGRLQTQTQTQLQTVAGNDHQGGTRVIQNINS